MDYPLKKLKAKKFSKRYTIWFEQANFDLQAAKYSRIGGFHEWACYQSTQAVEKAFKAIIIHAGWRPPRTHKLSVLIGMCNNMSKEFKRTKFKFRNLEIYTFIARYPYLLTEDNISPHDLITLEQANHTIDEAEYILNFVDDILKLPMTKEYKGVEEVQMIDFQKRLDYIKKKIIAKLNPERIILFGGYARNGKEKLSTIDILVITKTDLDFISRLHLVREITKGDLPVVSPVVLTPREYDTLLNQKGDSFLENAIEEGITIYEKI